jgi:ATP-dependent protease ClpP protease subunit
MRCAAFLLVLLLGLAPFRAAASGQPRRHIQLQGQISEQVVDGIEALFAEARQQKESIVLVINSPGGDVEAGMRLARDVEHADASCVVNGHADSMAFYVLQSCRFRLATSSSVLGAHEPFTLITEPGALRYDDIERMMRELKLLMAVVARHSAARMNIGLDEYNRRVRGRDWWMTPDEAVAVGALDGVLDVSSH